jgi:hypothetical protein
MRLVNTAIMASPANWIKVPLMAVFGMTALYLVAQLFVTPTVADE